MNYVNVPLDGHPWSYCYSHRQRWLLRNFIPWEAHEIAALGYPGACTTSVTGRNTVTPASATACLTPRAYEWHAPCTRTRP